MNLSLFEFVRLLGSVETMIAVENEDLGVLDALFEGENE